MSARTLTPLDGPLDLDGITARVKACAVEREEGRPVVHCFLDAPGLMLGADWDEADVVATVARAEDLAWRDYPLAMGHHLCVVADGRLFRFEVTPGGAR